MFFTLSFFVSVFPAANSSLFFSSETVTKDVTEATPPSESNLNSRPESSAISIPKTFKLKDLEKRTDKFSNRYLLGEGVFGKVYRGKLVGKDGVQKFVAIKRMSNPNPELKQEWTVWSLATHIA